MKRFFLISVLNFSLFALALTRASAADLALYSGPTNPGWISQAAAIANTEAIMNDARIKAIFENIENYGDGDEVGYDSPLGKWIQAHTGNGQQDVFIAASGTSPSAIYQFPNVHPDGSNIEKFVEDGNVFINVADYILFMSYEGGVRSANNSEMGAANVFDIPRLHFWPPRNDVVVFPTEIGKKYIPSLKAFRSNRPWNLEQFNGTDWEVTLSLSQTMVRTPRIRLLLLIEHMAELSPRCGKEHNLTGMATIHGQVESLNLSPIG